MTILYIFLAVIVLLLAILLFVLLSPLHVRIKYCEGITVFAGLSFIKFKVFPKKDKRNKKAKEKKKKKNNKAKHAVVKRAKNKNGGQDKETNDEGESSLKDTLTLVFDIVKSFFEMLGSKAKIRIDTLRVVVSKPDAADTAIQYGLCSGIVTSFLAFTSNFGKAVIKDDNVSISPDFITGKSRIEIDITLSARVVSILASIIKGYLKNKSRNKSTERADKNDK